jgi:hypothetical protein
LNGIGIRLDLPTAKAGAVVSDGEFEVHIIPRPEA